MLPLNRTDKIRQYDAKSQHANRGSATAALRLILVGIVSIWLLSHSQSVQAQLRDGFESGQPRLQLWRSDASAAITSHDLTGVMPYTGQLSESIEINSGSGSFTQLVYPIRPAALIGELSCDVFLRAPVSGLRVGFRVVLPRSANPAASGPTKLAVLGSGNQGGGKWSRLQITNIGMAYEEQLRVLRARVGYNVDASGAYVDAVVFDVYNGLGSTRLQIDDLAVDGLVEANQVVPMLPPNGNWLSNSVTSAITSSSSTAESLATQMQRLERSVPRWIQYRDESPDWLASLGMTGIVSAQSLRHAVLEQMQAARLQVTAPPPEFLTDASSTGSQTISSWYLSAAADNSDLDRTRQSAIFVGGLPSELARPRFVEAMEAHALFSRMAEIVALPIPLPTSVDSRATTDKLLQQQLAQLGDRSMPLASLVVEPSAGWQMQIATARSQLSRVGASPNADDRYLEALQTRLSVARAIRLGMKGFLFHSSNNLDSGRTVDLQRGSSIAAINAEIDLLSPWVSAGQKPVPLTNISNALYSGSSIATDRSQLAILTTQGSFDQIAAVSPADTKLEFVIPRRNTGERGYRITNGMLESLPLGPRPEGWGVTIDQPAMIEYIVLTSDSTAADYLQEATTGYANAVTANRLSIAGEQLSLAQAVLHSEGIRPGDPRWKSLEKADASLRSANTYSARLNNPQAIAACDQSINLSSAEIRGSWLRAVSTFQDPRSAALLASPSSLPEHWQLQQLVSNRKWERHEFPGGNIDDLQALIDAGWSQDRRQSERVAHRFEVVPESGPDGSAALLLAANSLTGEPIAGGFAGSTMRVRVPELQVPQGRLVRIGGKIRIDSGSKEPQSGILVYDSLASSAMGQPISAAGGKQGQWQSFELFRLVMADRPLWLYFEVRGEVTATIDSLTLHSVTISPQGNYVTLPTQ